MNGMVNVWSLQEGSLLQTLVGSGGINALVWCGTSGLAICVSRSQVWGVCPSDVVWMAKKFTVLIKCQKNLVLSLCYDWSLCPSNLVKGMKELGCNKMAPHFQNVVFTALSDDQFFKLRIPAFCRTRLHTWGMMGLHQAPCLRALLSHLPSLLLSQYQHEKPMGKWVGRRE